ncbi:MAG: ATP-dependent RecD-like DNA helicase [Gammaproteobacteria bacterium]|nr:ATP-dependent RecD-like DNA helicase [Gammaproteobacteria bacterium]
MADLFDQANNTQTQQLSGSVYAVRFYSEDSGWTVLSVKDKDNKIHKVTGIGHGIHAGQTVECQGAWETHPKFGRQFSASAIIPTQTNSTDALAHYLSSGAVEGLSKSSAERLIDAFGDKLPDILEHEPERLEAIDGIGSARRKKIAASWAKQKEVRDVMIFLQSHGMGPQRAAHIQRRYGNKAAAIINENPYRLAQDFKGIGFQLADTTARSLDIEADNPKRIIAGLHHVLQTQSAWGHCAIPEQQLIRDGIKLLKLNIDAISSGLEQAINSNQLQLDIINDERLIYLPTLRDAEIDVAKRLTKLTEGKLPWKPFNIEESLQKIESKLGVKLSGSQRSAAIDMANHKVCILTGGPGSGKTTLAKTVLSMLKTKVESIVLCAPTGRAARRLSEATGRSATTIHRLLKGMPGMGFTHDENNPIDADLILCDEMSMVDIELTNALLKSIPDEAIVIFVGDADQLPSVGPGKVLMDIINSDTVPVVRLTEIHRQAQNSSIVTNAHRVNHGQMPISNNNADEDFHFIVENNANLISQRLQHLVCEELPERYNLDPLSDIQVLSPMRKGMLGINELNKQLQNKLNPNFDKDNPNFLKQGDTHLSVGDRVVQISNNYEKLVFNGDNGIIVALNKKKKTLIASIEGVEVEYSFNEASELMLSYALTIHKSQGSEYKAVVIPITKEHSILLNKRLIYTAITRGKQLVVLIGQEDALRTAINSSRGDQRTTALQHRLQKINN